MPHASSYLLTLRFDSASKGPRPAPIVLNTGHTIREWADRVESFSEWITYVYEVNQGMLSFVLSAKLEKTVRATVELEEHLACLVEDDDGSLEANPFIPFNGYVQALTDMLMYIDRLLPGEKEDMFIATINRTLEKRLRLAREMAEERSRTNH